MEIHLRHLGRLDADRAIQCWEILVQHRHHPADSRLPLHQNHPRASLRQIQRGLNASYPTTDNQYRIAHSVCSIFMLNVFEDADKRRLRSQIKDDRLVLSVKICVPRIGKKFLFLKLRIFQWGQLLTYNLHQGVTIALPLSHAPRSCSKA